MTWVYPAGSFAALLASDAVTAPTRTALSGRGAVADRSLLLGDDAFAVLVAVAGRLAPRPDLGPPIATVIDARLAAGDGNGWRYAELPDDGAVYRAGLALIASAGFLALGSAAQDDVLRGVQGQPDTARFFAELLAEVTECAYAQPAALAAIGYSGFADSPGWSRIGLDETDPREAVERD